MTHTIDPSLPRRGFLIVGIKRNGSKIVKYARAWYLAADIFDEMDKSSRYEHVDIVGVAA